MSVSEPGGARRREAPGPQLTWNLASYDAPGANSDVEARSRLDPDSRNHPSTRTRPISVVPRLPVSSVGRSALRLVGFLSVRILRVYRLASSLCRPTARFGGINLCRTGQSSSRIAAGEKHQHRGP
jgi:hypothetical protein